MKGAAWLVGFILLVVSPWVGANSGQEETQSMALGSFAEAVLTEEGYRPGPGLWWLMDKEAFIEVMPVPEQLDPAHPWHDPGQTHPTFEGGRSSITPYQQALFTDVACTFGVTYSFNEEGQLCTVLLHAGPLVWEKSPAETREAWRFYTPIVADLLHTLYEHAGQPRTEEDILTLVETGHAQYPGIRAFFESDDGTFIALSTEYDTPGIVLILGLREYISPNRNLPRLWLP